MEEWDASDEDDQDEHEKTKAQILKVPERRKAFSKARGP